MQEIVSHCLDKKKDAKTVLDLGGGPVSSEFGLFDIRKFTLKKADFTEDELQIHREVAPGRKNDTESG